MKLAAHRIINGERKAQGERQICSPSLIQNESGDKMMLQKKKSGFILLEAVLAILLMSMASYGLAMTSALQFNQLEAKQVANEAEQYAMNEVEYLRRVGFDDLDEALHDRKSNLEFSGVDGWESVTSFVTEKAIDDDRSIKIAKVEVYKEGENIPRYSMEVPLSSQGNNSIGFPDYENGYSVSSDFIANKNGWLYSSATGRWLILINGKPVRQQVLNSDQIDGAIAPISSGDKVQIIMTQGGSRLNEIFFYPCR